MVQGDFFFINLYIIEITIIKVFVLRNQIIYKLNSYLIMVFFKVNRHDYLLSNYSLVLKIFILLKEKL